MDRDIRGSRGPQFTADMAEMAGIGFYSILLEGYPFGSRTITTFFRGSIQDRCPTIPSNRRWRGWIFGTLRIKVTYFTNHKKWMLIILIIRAFPQPGMNHPIPITNYSYLRFWSTSLTSLVRSTYHTYIRKYVHKSISRNGYLLNPFTLVIISTWNLIERFLF